MFFAWPFPADIISPVDLKIEVRAVKIGFGSIQAKDPVDLNCKYLNEFFIIISQK